MTPWYHQSTSVTDSTDSPLNTQRFPKQRRAMKLTLPSRLLGREQGGDSPYSTVRTIYGDRAWIDDLDIVNELGGHSGCVNALRYGAELTPVVVSFC
jgi:hypothetical protein